MEIRDGTRVHRLAYLHVPKIGIAFWQDRGAFLCCRQTARELHQRIGFDAIVSFDLLRTGGLAWRLAQDLGIPASGWAYGSDLRQRVGSALERVVERAIEHLDLVFYQSCELLERAAQLLGVRPEMLPKDKHVILPHGIPEPPSLPRTQIREKIRSALRIKDDQILVLNVGSVVRQKGIYELVDSISRALAKNRNIVAVIIGSQPASDETMTVRKQIDRIGLKDRLIVLPACGPNEVWEYLCAADIFAFTSHREGMPNSLLEAMIMAVPSIAFAIPPVLAIDAGSGSLVTVPPLDASLFAEAILRLASSPDERIRIGKQGTLRVVERFIVHKNMAEAAEHIGQMVKRHASAICGQNRRGSHQIANG